MVSPKAVPFWIRTASSRDSAWMTPSTGPKYSVRWKAEPSSTPVRTPGENRVPESSSWRGRESQASPSASSVSPERSFSPGASTTGPICAVGSVGRPTCRLSTASASCAVKRREVVTDPTVITREAAEHFWPAWPKALAATSRAARSRSACGLTMIEFLPLVSARIRSSGRQEANSVAVSEAPVRIS